MPAPSTPTLVAFVLLMTLVVAMLTALWHRAGGSLGRAGVAIGLWLVVTGLPVLVADPQQPFPLVPAFMIFMTACTFFAAFGPVGARLVKTPLAWLLGFHAFRIPLELVMHQWVEDGFLCHQMTWTGSNPDILGGVVGVLGLVAAKFHRPTAYGLNFVGLALLLNVIRVALTSIPNTPITQFDEPLWLPFVYPTIYIASIAVMGALLIHLVTIRKMLQPTKP